MLELSLPLHAAKYPSHGDHGDLKGDARLNKMVREVLDSIAEKHSTPASYMDDARKDLDEARNFARAKNLLTLPEHDNLQVIPTPEFERGIYAVGRIQSGAGARTAAWRVFLDHADSTGMAEGTRRIETARIQLLQLEAAGDSRGHAWALRAGRVRERRAAEGAPRAAGDLRQWSLRGRLGAVHYANDAGRGLLDNSPELRLTLAQAGIARGCQRDHRHPHADAIA